MLLVLCRRAYKYKDVQGPGIIDRCNAGTDKDTDEAVRAAAAYLSRRRDSFQRGLRGGCKAATAR